MLSLSSSISCTSFSSVFLAVPFILFNILISSLLPSSSLFPTSFHVYLSSVPLFTVLYIFFASLTITFIIPFLYFHQLIYRLISTYCHLFTSFHAFLFSPSEHAFPFHSTFLYSSSFLFFCNGFNITGSSSYVHLFPSFFSSLFSFLFPLTHFLFLLLLSILSFLLQWFSVTQSSIYVHSPLR